MYGLRQTISGLDDVSRSCTAVKASKGGACSSVRICRWVEKTVRSRKLSNHWYTWLAVIGDRCRVERTDECMHENREVVQEYKGSNYGGKKSEIGAGNIRCRMKINSFWLYFAVGMITGLFLSEFKVGDVFWIEFARIYSK